MPFTFTPVDAVADAVLVTPKRFEDHRGWFMEAYKASDFRENGLPADFVQDNHSRTAEPGTIRGLHLQDEPHAQGKLVRCLRGACHDVAVDLREDSPTYGEHCAFTLEADPGRMLWVPPGFAHGFQALEPDTHVHYKCTAEYAPDAEVAVRWDDPDLGIDWPVDDPVLNDRDAQAPAAADVDVAVTREGS